jgi:hypothetical protein
VANWPGEWAAERREIRAPVEQSITGLALAFRSATTLWLFYGAETVSLESIVICRFCGAALLANC